MSERVVIRKRAGQEWWRESGEVPDTGRLEEAFDQSRVKVGSDGRNGPDIKKMYTKPSDREFDDMGGSANHPKKGASDGAAGKAVTGGVSESRKGRTQKVREEFGQPEDEEFNSPNADMGMDGGMDSGMDVNPESDVPPEMDPDMDGDIDDGNMDGNTDVADDVTVEIGGQKFKLVPVMDGEGLEGEGGDPGASIDDSGMGEPGMEGGDDIGNDMAPGADENAVGAEEDDLSHPKLENTKRIRRALEMKRKVEKELYELFTGAYVTNKQGDDVGLDFSMIGGDDEFSVKAPAASGKQYTPSFPSTEGNGMKKTAEATRKPAAKQPAAKPVAAKKVDPRQARKAAFAEWIARNEAKLIEDSQPDPGQVSVDFSTNDTEDKQMGDDIANLPEVLGAEPDGISQYRKTQEARRQRRQESEQPVKFPSREVKADLEGSLEESFDFKSLMAGKYSTKVQG